MVALRVAFFEDGRRRIRNGTAALLSALPQFRGKGRLTLLADRFLTDPRNPASYLAVAELNGVHIELDLRIFGEKFLFYYRRYEPEYIDAVRRLYKDGHFLDIGSNIGTYVVSMARNVRDAGGRIISIEPIPTNVNRQLVNLRLNDCKSLVDLIQVAVGETSGSVLMGGSDLGASSVNGIVSPNGTLSVPLQTLDELSASRGWPRIGLIKIDVEGYEPPALRGAVKLIEQSRPVIFAEFNRYLMAMNGFRMEDSWRMLRDFGYRVHRIVDGSLQELSEPGEHENLFFLQ